MRKLLRGIFLAMLLGGWLVQAPTSAPSFSGVGDVKSGWGAWYGVIPYSLAYAQAGGNVFDISCNAGAITGTLTFNTSGNGTINHAAISGCSGTISITKRYDQSGANKCSAPCDMTSIGVGTDTFLTSGCPVTTVITDCESASGLRFDSAVITSTISQPMFWSAIFDRTTAGRGSINTVFGGDNTIQLGASNTNDASFCYAGNFPVPATSPLTDNALHTFQCLIAASSAGFVINDNNAAITGQDMGANTDASKPFAIGGGNSFTGFIYGQGERDGTMTTTDAASIAANEATNSGAP